MLVGLLRVSQSHLCRCLTIMATGYRWLQPAHSLSHVSQFSQTYPIGWRMLAHVAAVQLLLLAAMLWLLLVTSSATDADGFLNRHTSCSKGSQEAFQQRDLQAHLDRQEGVWKPQCSNNDLANLYFFSFPIFLIPSYSFNLKGNAIWDAQALLQSSSKAERDVQRSDFLTTPATRSRKPQ